MTKEYYYSIFNDGRPDFIRNESEQFRKIIIQFVRNRNKTPNNPLHCKEFNNILNRITQSANEGNEEACYILGEIFDHPVCYPWLGGDGCQYSNISREWYLRSFVLDYPKSIRRFISRFYSSFNGLYTASFSQDTELLHYYDLSENEGNYYAALSMSEEYGDDVARNLFYRYLAMDQFLYTARHRKDWILDKEDSFLALCCNLVEDLINRDLIRDAKYLISRLVEENRYCSQVALIAIYKQEPDLIDSNLIKSYRYMAGSQSYTIKYPNDYLLKKYNIDDDNDLEQFLRICAKKKRVEIESIADEIRFNSKASNAKTVAFELYKKGWTSAYKKIGDMYC